MNYARYFVHVEHSVCHEPISVLNNIYFIYIYIIYIQVNVRRETNVVGNQSFM